METHRAARSVGGSHSRKTNVHHDRCRPEVAVAQHHCPFSSCSGSPAPLRVGRFPSPSLSPLFGGRQSAALPVWTFCSAQFLGKTATLVPSRWSFVRRHMLDTGELMWTSVKRVGTRGIRPSAGAEEKMRRLGLVRPQDLVPSPSLGGPPAAGRQRVFLGASSLCRRKFPG